MFDLFQSGGFDTVTHGLKINDAGEISGSKSGGGVYNAFRYDVHADVYTDLHAVVGGDRSLGVDINDIGQVVILKVVDEPDPLTSSTSQRYSFVWAPEADLVQLPSLGATSTDARAINSGGQVVGRSDQPYFDAGLNRDHVRSRAFFWDPTMGIIDIGTAGSNNEGGSIAMDINDHGVVTGNERSSIYNRAFIWYGPGTSVQLLGDLGRGDSNTVDINNKNEITGTAMSNDNRFRGFYWSPTSGGMVDIGTLGGSSAHPVGISEHGEVAGNSVTSDGRGQAFYWSASSGMIGIVFGDGATKAHAINDLGQVTGYGSVDGETHAFLWDPTTQTATDLGRLPSDTYDYGGSDGQGLNNTGLVVGRSGFPLQPPHLVVWDLSTDEPPANTPPTADTGGPYSVIAGNSVTLDGSASDDFDGDVLAYEWDFDFAGSTFDVDATGITPVFSTTTASPAGDVTVALRVTDTSADSDVATSTVTIVSPTDAVVNLMEDVRALVDDGTLKSGQANGLIRPLGNAIRSLDTEQLAPACDQLQDFIAEANAKEAGGALPAGDADDLRQAASLIRSAVGCS